MGGQALQEAQCVGLDGGELADHDLELGDIGIVTVVAVLAALLGLDALFELGVSVSGGHGSERSGR